MSVQIAREKFMQIAKPLAQPTENIFGFVPDSGKLIAHTLFPNDFEYYMMSLELLDSGDNYRVTDRFLFPVNPDRIEIIDPKITTIRKTFGGIVSYTNDSFVPKLITLTGTFGRRFRLLVGNKITDDTTNSVDKLRQFAGKPFVPNVKTGYGSLRTLQRIYDKATKTASRGKPYIVNFYNLSYNQSFAVKFLELRVSQSKENNMLWDYSLVMKAVAPSENIKVLGDKVSSLRSGSFNLVNTKIAQVLSDVESGFPFSEALNVTF